MPTIAGILLVLAALFMQSAAAAPPTEQAPAEQYVVVPGLVVPVAEGLGVYTAVPDRRGTDDLAAVEPGGLIGTLDLGLHDAAERMDARQTGIELIQTSLLNQLGNLGFSRLEQFRKVGEGYEADLRTASGLAVDVTVDPANGEIRKIR